MKQIGLRLLKIVHLIFAIMWAGGAAGMMLLIWLDKDITQTQMHDYAAVLKILDDILVTPGAEGCLVTGIIYGFTRWGVIRHGWVIVKWLLTLFMVITGTFIMGPPVNCNAALELPFDTAAVDTYWTNVATVELWGDIQIALLLLVVILSVTRPWPNLRKKQK